MRFFTLAPGKKPGILLAIVFLVLCHGRAMADTLPESISEELRISGRISFSNTVTVNKEGVLILEAGTRLIASEGSTIVVHGRIVIQGTKKNKVTIEPDGDVIWKGISFYAGASGVIENLELAGAETGIGMIASELKISGTTITGCEKGIYLIKEAVAHVEDCRILGNKVGLVAEMKSSGSIHGSLFKSNEAGIGIASGATTVVKGNRFFENATALQIYQRYSGTIMDNHFEGNKTAIRLYQNGPDTVVERNLFIDNTDAAILALSYTSPVISNNQISGGRYGIVANQFSSPTIMNNRIERMSEALHLNKKNISNIGFNVISDSETGIFCDFSSYPKVRNNVLKSNKLHVKLGRFQSSHWESNAGSKKLVMQQAANLGSRNPRLANGPEDFPEAVDMSGNWWDKNTMLEIREKGPDVNVTGIYDGHDLPEVTYEGFGDESYRLDKVIYSPVLEKIPPEAGLKGWKGRRQELGQ